jgi:predicted nucleic acid-binding protein
VTPIVADASALVEYLLRTPRSGPVASIVENAESFLDVPALCDVEVTAALRRLAISGSAEVERVRQALADYLDLRLIRHGHQLLLPRILELRENFSAYDAAYVALAERLGASFLTADEPLARAVRRHTNVALA